MRAGSAKRAAVPGVLVPSEERSTEALRKVAIYGKAILDCARPRHDSCAVDRVATE